MNDHSLAIYQADNGAIELSVDAANDTIWATQKQIADVFDVTPQNITIHVNTIYTEGELSEDSTCKESLQVQREGNREVKRTVKQYNLDMIIAIGYRISSGKGTAFRKWATQTLRAYISDGYAINPARIQRNQSQFIKALEDLKLLSSGVQAVGSDEATDLAMAFARTWVSLDAYDKSQLPTSGTIKRTVQLGADDLIAEIDNLKTQLIAKGEATVLFAAERDTDGLRGLFGNVFQVFDGKAVYPTLEEKAAHLLYFVVKNHVFVDGNKRTGAFAFVWFLQRVGLLDTHAISPQALTVITLLVAESNPAEKDKIIGLILLLLGVSANN